MIGSPLAGRRALAPLGAKALLPSSANARIDEQDGVSPLPPLGMTSLFVVRVGAQTYSKQNNLARTHRCKHKYEQRNVVGKHMVTDTIHSGTNQIKV